jgi:hypothetical protein
MGWAIGITTAPRDKVTLRDTIESLKVAGWDKLLVLCEPGSEIFPHPGVEYHIHDAKLGAWSNWRFALQVLTRQENDYVAIVQDDMIVRPGLRKYLEDSIITSVGVKGLFSPYKAAHYHYSQEGWCQNKTGWNLCGACFYAMNLTTAKFMDSKLPKTVRTNRHIDAYVGSLFLESKLTLMVHNPSLAQHTADDNSTLGIKPNPHIRKANDYTDKPIGE